MSRKPDPGTPVYVGQKRRHPATGQVVTITSIHPSWSGRTRVSFFPPVGISYAYAWAVQTWAEVK